MKTKLYEGLYENMCVKYNNIEYYIPRKDKLTALDGDIVKFEINIDDPKKGKIKKILKRNKNEYYGIIRNIYKKNYYIYCSDLGKQTTIKVISDDKLFINDLVKFKVMNWLNKFHEVEAIILQNYSTEKFINILMDKYNLSTTYPIKINEEKIANFLQKELNNPNRKSYINDLVFTIDPVDAKDYDDAISIKKTNNNYILSIHISDVSFFIKPGTKLDKEAYKRANTMYLSETILPMIPPLMADKYCSLMENESRLTASVDCYFDFKGNLEKYEIHRGIIKSNKRFNYDQVNSFYENKNIFSEELNTSLKYLKELFDLIYKPSPIVKLNYISFDENNNLICKGSGLAQNMIETFMVLANNIVASELDNKNKQLPNRYHDKPNKEIEKTDSEIINTINLLKTFKGAEYTSKKSGHYGLDLKNYCHFTSPIRRYIDLIIHRLLFTDIHYTNIEDISKHCTKQQRLTTKIENEYTNYKFYNWIDKNKDKIFDGIILEVKHLGVNIYIPNIAYEGFIHISKIIPNSKQYLIDLYKVNQNIKLQIESVNKMYQEIEWKIKNI
jgi:ribonuclease R